MLYMPLIFHLAPPLQKLPGLRGISDSHDLSTGEVLRSYVRFVLLLTTQTPATQPSSLSASPVCPRAPAATVTKWANYATQKKRKPGLVDSSSPSKRQRIGYEESSQMPSPTTEVSKAEEESFNVEIATVFFTVGIAFRAAFSDSRLMGHYNDKDSSRKLVEVREILEGKRFWSKQDCNSANKADNTSTSHHGTARTR
ncbi:hypothetical protein GQ600_27466 [Phytophthora cactorum]|nr:hypothetical protein GQ600_27466 [Phytophthora cactorum]